MLAPRYRFRSSFSKFGYCGAESESGGVGLTCIGTYGGDSKFDAGGISRTRTSVWPVNHIRVQPVGRLTAICYQAAKRPVPLTGGSNLETHLLRPSHPEIRDRRQKYLKVYGDG